QLEYPIVYGRVPGGESLVEAGRSLLYLDDFPAKRLTTSEFAETDEDWGELIDAIQPPELAEHIAMFFQEADSARCTGAAFDDHEPYSMMTVDGEPRIFSIASWWIGEGQGNMYLCKIVDDTILPVPAFEGRRTILKPPPERSERSRPPV